MKSSVPTLLIIILAAWCDMPATKSQKKNDTKSYKPIPVALVPASFPVNFALTTVGKQQYVAYFDSAHQMTIAQRKLTGKKWRFQPLNSKVPWDSHNYLSMEVDKEGIIHLVGNMHSSPLVYFRSTRPYDVTSMQAIHKMTGSEEDVTTYPEFMHSPDGDLVFHCRYGRSGSGYEVYNIWNYETHQWERLLDKPLTDGLGKRNAYMQGPILGPDGYYHLIWVWRDSPDCSTNHTLSHARSKDLLNWESVRGEKLPLPITLANKETYVDTTAVKGGLINIGIKIGFDSKGQLLIGYHKYDANGNTQLFLARFGNGQWESKQVTNWNYRWDFKGWGTIVNELLIDSPKPAVQTGQLVFGYHHYQWGDGQITVNETSFEPISSGPVTTDYPKELDVVRSNFKGMLVHKVFGKGTAPKGQKYLLRWEALPPNRDQKPQGTLPEPWMLEVVKY
ncbi:MAG: BNR repeat-containing protein [Breznakibacter sp.]